MSRLNWGDTITYTQATGWHRNDTQPASSGPYTDGIVGFENDGLGGTVVQVRADGWMGNAPIMAVDPSDIIDTNKREQGDRT